MTRSSNIAIAGLVLSGWIVAVAMHETAPKPTRAPICETTPDMIPCVCAPMCGERGTAVIDYVSFGYQCRVDSRIPSFIWTSTVPRMKRPEDTQPLDRRGP